MGKVPRSPKQENAMKRSATANWKGSLKAGKGTFSSTSGAFASVPYDTAGRFETGTGTSPEELIAAAHASCFAMALSAELEKVGLTPQNIDSKATVSLDKVEVGWAVTTSHLEVTVTATPADKAKFEQAANAAKTGCPISKLIAAAKITLDAKLA
jgi:osmotically inducible protein OsmC